MSGPGLNPVLVAAQVSEVPAALQNSRKPKMVPMKVSTVVVPSQSGTQGPAGQILFQLSNNAGYVKPGSMYLRCNVTLTGTAGANNTTVSWGNMSRSADALISRLVISSGSQIESISNYGHMCGVLLTHASNQSYCNGDHRILTGGVKGGANTVGGWNDVAGGGAINETLQVCIPIQSNLFNGDQAFPLFLLAQHLTIQLDLASVSVAFSINPLPAPINYSVSNAQIVYDLVQPDATYLNIIRQQLQPDGNNPKGNLYSIPFVSCLSMQNAATPGTTNLNVGLGMSSLKAYLLMMQEEPTNLIDDKSSSQNGLNNMRTYLDAQIQSSVILDSLTSQYSALQKAFGVLQDVNRTGSAPGIPDAYRAGYQAESLVLTPKTYRDHYFCVGESYTKLHEAGFSLNGSACSQFNVILDGLAAACTATQFFFHDCLLVVDHMGTVNVVR